jgi:FkbM family methyltransferase
MYYAEYETDKYIHETYFPDFSYHGIMVEVGAGPPEVFSTSKYFRDNGWRCICIEPNPKFVKQHIDHGNEIYPFACSDTERTQNFQIVTTGLCDFSCDGMSYSALKIKEEYLIDYKTSRDSLNIENIQVEVKKLNTILEDLKIDKIDFLSIDTEGWELEVMRGFNPKKFNPKIILLENVLHLNSYEEYMNGIEYKLDKVLKYNYIFRNKGFCIEGISAAQHPDIVKPFLKIINNFDRIIEIGTWKGALTLFLYKNKQKDCELISYEIDPSIIEIPKIYNIDVRIGDCFSEKTHNEIKELIENTNKKVLLLCDGGNKIKEFETFCKYLKPDDVIMSHDYADNFEDWLKHTNPINWIAALQSSYDAFLNIINENNLEKYKYYDDFKAVLWGAFTKILNK